MTTLFKVPVTTMKDIVTLSQKQFRTHVRERLEVGYVLPEMPYCLLPDNLKKVYLEELWSDGSFPMMYETDKFSKQIFIDAIELIYPIVRTDVLGFCQEFLSDNGYPYEPNKGWKRILKPLNINYSNPI